MHRERIGKYTIVGELGRGTMGEVYKAHDPVLNRFVALKTLPARLGPDNETLQRFQREAQAAALLNHPNIVTVHDFGEEDGLLYMAMELLEGIDLREAIDGGLLKTLDEKMNVMDSTLAALDYAHAKGVVHRDIKPANIHLGKSRVVKIMDFGLARVSTSEMTQEGIVLGTPNYMSPEQALGDKVDGRSDIFSTGAVLYELLTGHKPFEADTTPSVLFQVVHKQPPPVRRWAPETPAAVVAVVNRALEKELERRFASAGDMRAALAIAREGLAAARSAPAPQPQAPPPRTRLAPPPLPASAAPVTKPPASTPPPIRPPSVGARGPGSTSGEGELAARPRRVSTRPLLIGAAVAVLALALAAAGLWLRSRGAPAAPVATATDALTQELLSKQLRLARAELDDKNYRVAITEAQGVLKLAPGQADARAIISAAQDKLDELERSVAQARRLVEAGDTAGASHELGHLLELDPRHPAAAELTGRLNSAFQAQAQAAAVDLRAARDDASKAGAAPEALRAADLSAQRGDELMASGEFAEAARTFLETRDTLDRARRSAAPRRVAAPRPDAAAVASVPEASPATPPPTRGFTADATSVSAPGRGGPAGFDGAQMAGRATQFNGRVEFEVLPPAVRAGEPFVVRIHLRNDGRKSVKIRGLALAAVVDGQRVPASAVPLLREVQAQSRALVAEYSGVWASPREWALEAVVTADKDEKVSSRLKAN
jgi:serine/threonine protein kinase/tetratricopeptide (TPR) repeat protein